MSLGCYSYIRNGITNGYPFIEAYLSWKQYACEFVIIDGYSNDGTWEILLEIQKNWKNFKLYRQKPKYLNTHKDAQGLLLGEIFESARQKLDSEWQVMVQADCVFHYETIYALNLVTQNTPNIIKAFTILRNQYRWNWQEMYWQCKLDLCTRKDFAKVAGDGLNLQVNGFSDKRLVPLFKKYPIADCAWCFWENLLGKVKSCSEIWTDKEDDIKNNNFTWYDKELKRSFKQDYNNFKNNKIIPNIFTKKHTKYLKELPLQLKHWIGNINYNPNLALKKINIYNNIKIENINNFKLNKPKLNFKKFYLKKLKAIFFSNNNIRTRK